MKTYICTKIIRAVPAKMVNGCIWPEGLPLPKAAEEQKRECAGEQACSCNTEVRVEEGYMYVTGPEDRYPQWMPKAEFEKMCLPEENLTFGDALAAAKLGEKVARAGWNGKGMYVFLAKDPEFHTEADIGEFEGKEVDVPDVLVLRTAQGTLQVGWLASQADMLAEDWHIVE